MRIAYIVDRFPSLSETFVLREMTALRERGHQLVPVSLGQGETEVIHDAALPFLPDTVTRPPFLSPAFTARCWRALAGRPAALLRASFSHLRATARRQWPLTAMLGCLGSAWALTPSILHRQLDRIHAQFGGYTGIVGLLLSRITGLPYSFSMHARDLFVERSPRLTEQVVHADFVTVCTEYGLGVLRGLTPSELHGKLHLVRHGLDLPAFDALLADTEAHPHEDLPRVLAVGRLVPKKGFDVLLRALARLRESGRTVAAEIVGSGPLGDELLDLARELSVDTNVYFMGALANTEVLRHLKGVAMLVAPSVVAPDGDQDGLPNVILEALAAAVPVVASDLAGIPEAVQDGRTGLLVPPGDHEALAAAIARLLDDRSLAAGLAAAGRRMAEERFDLRRNIRPLLDLFEGRYPPGIPSAPVIPSGPVIPNETRSFRATPCHSERSEESAPSSRSSADPSLRSG